MSSEKKTCKVCGKKTVSVTVCKSCGREYCEKCQSPSTNAHFCKDCVAMEGVISKS